MPWAPPWPPPMRPVRSPRSTRTSPSAPRRPPEAQTPTPSSTPAARMTAPPSTITGRGTYHPGLQRFISEDPIGLRGGVNLYAYVANAPTRFTDPRGLHPLKSPLGGLIPHHHRPGGVVEGDINCDGFGNCPQTQEFTPEEKEA